jgi:hypothetical protein
MPIARYSRRKEFARLHIAILRDRPPERIEALELRICSDVLSVKPQTQRQEKEKPHFT